MIWAVLLLTSVGVSSGMMQRALLRVSAIPRPRMSLPRLTRSFGDRSVADGRAAATAPYIEDGAILLGDIITDSTADGMAILQSRDEAQMTGKAGDLLDFGDGRQGFVVWARPPIYFVQVMPDEATGELPLISEGSNVRLPLLPDVDMAKVAQSLQEQQASEQAGADGAEGAAGDAEGGQKKETIAPALQISVGDHKFGRITDFLDRPLDGLGPLGDADATTRSLPVFNAEPEKGSTESLSRGLATGVMAADVLTPLGRGQTMLVAGPNGVGRTELALDTVQAQASARSGPNGERPVSCVWACLRGQGKAVAEELAERGALATTAIIEAPAGSPPSVQFATAAAALAVAEGVRNNGADSLVVLDDISNLSTFWDDTTRVLLDQ